jgi:hypothetical protein
MSLHLPVEIKEYHRKQAVYLKWGLPEYERIELITILQCLVTAKKL